MGNLVRMLVVGAIGSLAIATATPAPVTPPSEPLEIARPAREAPTIEQTLVAVASPRIRAILEDLIPCESGGRPEATNPLDLDGTPSHGLLQFKPGTLYQFVKEFELLPDIERAEIANVLYDAPLQIRTAEKMIDKYGDSRAFWEQQWPACSRLHNYWTGY